MQWKIGEKWVRAVDICMRERAHHTDHENGKKNEWAIDLNLEHMRIEIGCYKYNAVLSNIIWN